MSAETQKDCESTREAFSNELILEHILHFVITDDCGHIDYSNVQSCRLVHSTWLQAVSRKLRKLRKHTFYQQFPSCFHPESTLNAFVSMVTNSAFREESRLPSTAIKISEHYFEESTLQDISDCMSLLGSGLVGLDLYFPEAGCNGDLIIGSNLDLPLLENICICFASETEVNFRENFNEETAYGGNINITSFTQLVLSGCKTLKMVDITGSEFNSKPLPLGFENLRLPSTLTKLVLQRGLRSKHLLGLMSANLPNLKELVLPFTYQPFENNVIFTVLEKVCETLEKLTFYGSPAHNFYFPGDQPTAIKLPRMKSLRLLVIHGCNVTWETDAAKNEAGLQLPALKKMDLGIYSGRKFYTWVMFSRYESVSCVKVVLNENLVERPERSAITSVGLIRMAFSNIIDLDLTFIEYTFRSIWFGLQGLFKNLKQLKKLSLSFEPKTGIVFNVEYWNALLVGISTQRARDLGAVENDEWFWERFFQKPDLPSITHLSELQSLKLAQSRQEHPIVCDVVFRFALMHMPALQHVYLHGAFEVSNAMAERWKAKSRVMNYSRYGCYLSEDQVEEQSMSDGGHY